MVLSKISNKEEFKDKIILDKSIVMIHKDDCPFCKKAMPWMEEFSEEYKDVSISEANEKNIREVLDHFQVKMYPTFVYFSEGKVIDIFFGDTQYDKVREFIEKNI